MKRLFLITLILTLAALFMQAPVSVISPSGIVCAQEPEAKLAEEAATEVNINTASAEELAALEGIGDKKFEKIKERILVK